MIWRLFDKLAVQRYSREKSVEMVMNFFGLRIEEANAAYEAWFREVTESLKYSKSLRSDLKKVAEKRNQDA